MNNLLPLARRLTLTFCLLVLTQAFAISTTNASSAELLQLLDISERARDGGTAIAIQFSQALDRAQNIDEYLRISRANGPRVDGGWVLSDNARTAWFEHIEPSTNYTIRVYPGLHSDQGQRLTLSSSVDISTRKVTPGAEFKNAGHFLPAGLARGLTVSSINVPEVNIDFFLVDDEHMTAFLQDLYYRSGAKWSQYYIDRMTGHAKLRFSGRYRLNPATNKRGDSAIDLQNTQEVQAPGLYMAVLSIPGQYAENRSVAYFAVTDIGLHSRIHGDRIDAIVSSIATGQAMPDIDLSLLDDKGKVLASARSDDDGFASFKQASDKAQYLLARQGRHLSYLPLQGPALDLSQFDLGLRDQRSEEIFVYAPRDLYRPGESIDFNALRRDGDGRRLDDIPLQVNILRPDRVSAKTFVWHPDQPGYYHHRYDLPADARTGNWTLQVTGVDKNAVEFPFKVEEFLPERLEFEFNNGQQDRLFFDPKSAMQVPITGRYLYGAPAAGNRFGAWVSASQGHDIVESLYGFRFGHVSSERLQSFEATEMKLDEQGGGILKIEPTWPDIDAALEVKLVGNLYESGGRAVSRIYSTYTWPRTAMLGIKPEFDDLQAEAHSKAAFRIVKSTRLGQLLAARDLEVTLIREDRNYFWEYDEHEGWRWQWTDKEYAVHSQLLDLDGKSETRLELPVEDGRYRLEILDRDNNRQLSSLRFRAGEDWYAWWRENNNGRAAARPDQVNLAFDKAAYRAGDVARLRVVPPHAGQAVITVESDRLLWFTRRLIPAEGATIDIPIDAGWQRHDLYVSALVFKAGDAGQGITPNRAIGLRHLPLDRSERRLSIAIDTPDKIRPGGKRQFRIKVDGNGPTQLTLAAVDAGALAVSDFETPDPFEGFFGQRRYRADQRDIYGDIIELNEAEGARLRFGGDASLARGGQGARSDVQIVSLFSGPVQTDADGHVEVELDIPEFEGRLRLMALAFGDDAFGSAERDITVASPVIAQLSMPRFLAFGDSALLVLDVTNMSGEARAFDLELETDYPLQLLDGRAHKIELEHTQRRRVAFVVRAGKQNASGAIRARLNSAGLPTLNREWKLAVRSPYPAVTENITRVLDAGQQLDLADQLSLERYQADSVQALVSISDRPLLQMQEHLDNLLGYPYGCLEQTTSKAFPLSYATQQNLASSGVEHKTPEQIQQYIDRGIERLASLQKSSGGFGLWDSDSAEEHWLTAYASDFLLKAHSSGFNIDEPMLTRALERLQYYLRQDSRFLRQRYSDAPGHYALATKAYAAYLLADLNRVTLGDLRSLFERESGNAKTALPLVQLGLALGIAGDQKRQQQALELAFNMPTSEQQEYLGDYGSPIRDTAMIIHLLGRHGLHANKMRALGHQLARELHSRQWLSTQERSALFLAGIALNQLPASDWEIRLDADDSQQLKGPGSVSRLLDHRQIGERLIVTALKGDGLYSSISLSGYLKEAPQAVENGLTITRHYLDMQGKPLDLDRVRSGDRVLVYSMLGAERKTPDALLVDLIPAGFELENQNLNHSQSLTDLRIEDQSIDELQRNTTLLYQEFRDDRYVAALDLNAHGQAHVVYMMRAVTPGQFSVPAAFVEDMYRPEYRAIGQTPGLVVISSPE